MTLTNDTLMIIVNLIIIVGIAIRLENRLTKLETSQEMLLKYLIRDVKKGD
jgi:hypothetical protein